MRKLITHVAVLILTAWGIYNATTEVSQALNSKTKVPVGVTYNTYVYGYINPDSSYSTLVSILQQAKDTDTVIMHIASPGGDGVTVAAITNAVRNSKAKTIAIVEGPSASGAVFIADAAKKVRLLPGLTILAHTVGTHGFDCLDTLGKLDRGQFKYDKCLHEVSALDYVFDNLINQMKILTKQEKEQAKQGYDIILKDTEVNKRLEVIHALAP